MRSQGQSAEAERRCHKDEREADDDGTNRKVEKHQERREEAVSQERSRDTGGKHSASNKHRDIHCRDNDRSRSTFVDVERRHHKDRSDSRDGTGSRKVEKQRDRRAEDEHCQYGSRRHSDEDRRDSEKRQRRR